MWDSTWYWGNIVGFPTLLLLSILIRQVFERAKFCNSVLHKLVCLGLVPAIEAHLAKRRWVSLFRGETVVKRGLPRLVFIHLLTCISYLLSMAHSSSFPWWNIFIKRLSASAVVLNHFRLYTIVQAGAIMTYSWSLGTLLSMKPRKISLWNTSLNFLRRQTPTIIHHLSFGMNGSERKR